MRAWHALALLALVQPPVAWADGSLKTQQLSGVGTIRTVRTAACFAPLPFMLTICGLDPDFRNASTTRWSGAA